MERAEDNPAVDDLDSIAARLAVPLKGLFAEMDSRAGKAAGHARGRKREATARERRRASDATLRATADAVM